MCLYKCPFVCHRVAAVLSVFVCACASECTNCIMSFLSVSCIVISTKTLLPNISVTLRTLL